MIKRKKVQLAAEAAPKSKQAPRLPKAVRAAIVAGKLVAGLAFCMIVSRGVEIARDRADELIEEAKAAVAEKLTVTQVVTEFKEVDDATLGEIIAKVSKDHGVDPLVMTVLAEKESSGGRNLYRFEAGKFAELQGSKKYRGISSDELRMVASSHGVFHVMGYSAYDFCGLHWSYLYNPWISAKCAATIVAKHYADTEHIRDASARVREVFKRFNGSGEAAEKYADDAMGKLAAILYKRVAAPAGK